MKSDFDFNQREGTVCNRQVECSLDEKDRETTEFTSCGKERKENSKINTIDFQQPYFKNLIEVIILRSKPQRKEYSGKLAAP